TPGGGRGGPRRQRRPELNEGGRRKVGTGVATAVRPIVRLLAAQPPPTELILVAVFASVEAQRFLLPAPGGEGGTVDVGRAGPHAAKPCPGCPHVIIHLPTRAQPVALIRSTDRFHHLAADDVAEVGQAVKRLQAARGVT